MKMTLFHFIFLSVVISYAFPIYSQNKEIEIKGQITDELKQIIIGAKVILTNYKNEKTETFTDQAGFYIFKNVQFGNYRLTVQNKGFAEYQNNSLIINAETQNRIDVVLLVEIKPENVNIPAETKGLNTNSDNNQTSRVIKGEELEILPDDAEELENALKALAGNSFGPDGGDFYVDGILTKKLPPKSSIKEIRINQNPFSAEYERLGFGRIEIITKVGSDDLSGSVFFRFNDRIFNARNAFALTRPPFQVRGFGGDISNSFLKNKATYFIDFDRRETDDSAIINATILDNQLQIKPFKQIVPVIRRKNSLNLRNDFQLGSNNTLSIRYGLTALSVKNNGIGGFSLETQGYESSNNTQTIQIAQTSIFKETIINELRFQFEHDSRKTKVVNSNPSIVVSDSFVGGNSSNGNNQLTYKTFDLSNNLTFAPNNQVIRTGFKIRGAFSTDVSRTNFNGKYIFTGGFVPRLLNGQIVFDNTGQPILEFASSLERYRRTLFFGQQGLTQTAIRQRGGGANQFLINGGNPLTKINQIEVSGFLQDDWRLKPNLSLNLGLRFETQTNIKRSVDLAPRIALAFSKESGKNKKFATVFRLGFGVFYSRFNDNLVLQAEKFNGERLKQFVVTDTSIIDQFSGVPLITNLTAFGQNPTLQQISPNLRVPVSLLSVFSWEQQLPSNTILTVAYNNLTVRRFLRSSNINAPLAGSFTRLFPALGNIYRYESSGRFNSNRFTAKVTKSIGKMNNLSFEYNLTKAKSDSDGAGSFPINQHNFLNEYSNSAIDIRHRFIFSGVFVMPLKIRLFPLVIATSGQPFNIITGEDTNGDSIFTERPAFATDTTRPSVVFTNFGIFDRNPSPNSIIIPRNFGRGPSYFATSLRITRSFKLNFNKLKNSGFPQKYTLNFSSSIWNFLNRTNLSLPVGNLSSPVFGKSIRLLSSVGDGDPLSGSRVIEFQLRLSF
jgi:Carboxypeptidase regulatory-like domain/TonB dependent receptor